MQKKIGVLLVNLGTPDSATTKDLKKYLQEFLSDKRVVNSSFPRWLWLLILNMVILNIRPKKSAIAYKKIWNYFGNGSPLLDISIKQQSKIAQKLGDEYQVEFAMRYGNPSIKSKIAKLQNCKQIIVLPLYPQYSKTTTTSIFDKVSSELQQINTIPKITFIDKYFDNEKYINAVASSITKHIEKFGKADKLIFSYHGIPKKYIKNGDIYEEHCQQTTKLLVQKLELSSNDYLHNYQSRFGREEWLNPYLSETLTKLPKDNITSVQVVCPGFASDCLETLEEICEENKMYFLNSGGKRFEYIFALNDSDEHIDCLTSLIKNNKS